jgi:hypothetical protein
MADPIFSEPVDAARRELLGLRFERRGAVCRLAFGLSAAVLSALPRPAAA